MSDSLRVLTYNLHKGRSSFGKRNVLPGIRQGLQQLGTDIVFLQEVMGHSERKKYLVDDWPTAAQYEYLADQVWPHFAYAKNAVFSDRHHGNVILSKFPIVEWENIDLSLNRFEKRALLHAVAHDPIRNVHYELFCVHVNLGQRSRHIQIRKIAERIKSHAVAGRPLLMCGDFNDWRTRAARLIDEELGFPEAYLQMNGKFARTFPSFAPILPLDRIYYRDLQPQRVKALYEHPWNQLSDHVALTAEFAIPK